LAGTEECLLEWDDVGPPEVTGAEDPAELPLPFGVPPPLLEHAEASRATTASTPTPATAEGRHERLDRRDRDLGPDSREFTPPR
jgi:hypothetical protein